MGIFKIWLLWTAGLYGAGPLVKVYEERRPQALSLLPCGKKELAVLTFDDGPSPRTTPAILEILAQHKIKAVFFVLGEQAERYPWLIKKIVESGHELGNHSFSHPSFRAISHKRQLSELKRTNEILQKHVRRPRWFRAPYGIFSKKLAGILSEHRLQNIFWSIDPRDWKNPSPRTLVRRVIGKMHPGAIILLHDHHKNTVKALPEIITKALAKGYTFTTLKEGLAGSE